ncbi:CrcB family protein [Bifidobacterium sp. 64T4]|uniref:FluC/FEX family fluoride channel n=1 Tax=Bifidobacterium pongonis TaxID=2834432 RepID=UPI001C5667AF|nr:CrcB family protein [Bifidobacterium pongonis]MBW3094540.1 CrcB family protein [Bifidobacterium pongonis]
MTRQHFIRFDLVCVVFLGGCIGTALRYALSGMADLGSFHIGTFTANMIACFAYAMLSAWLGGTGRLAGRAKEYVNRGFGMGMCGGLSTMSTLALEEFMMLRGGDAAGCALYCCVTFVVGCMLAYAGVLAGLRLAGVEGEPGGKAGKAGKEASR